ncbi:MAG: ABC transporter substrate-binding protein [Bacteroidetes bacterium]|nr:ABC transporter substrate-binding protein [Bacteroidota bacterium]
MKLIAALLTTLFFLSCSSEQPSEETELLKPEYGGTLTYAKNGPAITMDPAIAREGESSIVISNIYEGLIEQQAGKAGINPGLARSWDISEDGKTYTFHLRSGVQFHDGTPFNAEAVLLSFERQRDPKNPYHRAGRFEFWDNLGMSNIISSWKAVDDSTVEFVLGSANPTFLNLLSLYVTSIVSPTALKKYGDDIERNPVGTGPFKFLSWSDDGVVTVIANNDYWNGRPYLDTIIFKPIPSAKDRWKALKAGEIDMMAVPDQADIGDMDRTAGVKSAKQPGINICYMAMNMKKKPFDDLRIRQAIVYAINREKLVRELYGQLGRPAKNPIPPMLIGYNEEIRYTPYDPEKSKQLLKEAGYPKGFKAKLWTMPIIREYMPNGKLAAEIIQRDLKVVGIETEIYSGPTWKEHTDRISKGEHELAIFGWIGDAPDPNFFFSPLLSSESANEVSASNIAFYKSAKMDELIHKGISVFDPVERSQIYKQGCELFNEDLPWFTIAHSVSIVPMAKYVQGFKLHSSSIRKFGKTWIQKDQR